MKFSDVVRLILTTRFGDRAIASALGVSKTTVRRYRRLTAQHGRPWDELKALPPSALNKLFNPGRSEEPKRRRPDLNTVLDELAQPGSKTTRQLLWEEYREADPENALSYSRFTALVRTHAKRSKRSMRQMHPPGEAVFVDFSGKKPSYIDTVLGRRVEVELFVAVLGASNYVFATCLRNQAVPDWLAANAAMLQAFGGAPTSIVPDNLAAAVSKPVATRTNGAPMLQRDYAEFGRHFDVAIMPTRTYRPRDKAKVEVGVQVVQRWVLARLRHQHFFSLDELNTAVAKWVAVLNDKPQRHVGTSRRELFERLDKPALRPLPALPFVHSRWAGEHRVPSDYHLAVDGHFYSVPHRFVGERVEARTTAEQVEFWHDGTRVAAHARGFERGGATTAREHQPEAHRAQADRNPTAMRAWADGVGPSVSAIVDQHLDRAKPMLGMPACESLKKLVGQYGAEAVERACARAVKLCTTAPSAVLGLLRNERMRSGKKPATVVPPNGHLRNPSPGRPSHTGGPSPAL